MIRTADATLFTFCPPGPLARTKATISMSASGISISPSSSSKSGTTSTEAKLVCRLPWALNGLGRTSRCTPASAHVAIGVFTLDQQRDIFDAGLFAPGAVDFGDVPALALEMVEIHAQEHLGPILGLGAAGAGVNLHETVFGIVLAVEKGLQLDLVGPLFQVGQRAVGLVQRSASPASWPRSNIALTSSMSLSIASIGSMPP